MWLSVSELKAVPVEGPYPDEDSHWSGGVEPDEKLKAVPVEDPYLDEDSHV